MKTTISADGETSEFLTTSRSLSVTLNSSGNGFGSGTVTLQVQDGSDWFNVHSWTADGSNEVVIGKDRNFRFDMNGSTSPTVNIYHVSMLDSTIY